MNIDMAIIREWAEAKVSGRHFATDCDLKVARYILATTPSPTMADLDWDNDVHAGLCAESADDGVVRMIGLDWENDHADHIMCYLGNGQFDSLPFRALTPIPGTRLDLTPRRDPVPEPTPEHPEVLTTEEDYGNAPKGTVVAMGAEAWTKTTENEWSDPAGRVDDKYMSSSVRRVLRWGWGR